MKLGFYPGCSMHGTAREFEESLTAVVGALDVQLAEIDDWSCCGASSAHSTNHLMGVALPARNLALAEAQGLDAVVAPCAACFSRLAGARHELSHDATLAQKVRGVLDRPFENRVAVQNVVELFGDRLDVLKAAVKRPLKGLKVACYYGCLLVRPQAVSGACDVEKPCSMEKVAEACGAVPVAWNSAVECCGGGYSLSRPGSVIRLGRAILDDARKCGADALLVGCPMCHSNLDFRQKGMLKDGEAAMPILYLSELVGLALDLPDEVLGLGRHFVDPRGLRQKVAEAEAKAAAEEAAKKAAAEKRAAEKAAAAAKAPPKADKPAEPPAAPVAG